MSHDPHIHVEEEHSDTKSAASVFVRVIVILAMLLILFFIAVAIVKFVPKFISSFGQANVSLTSLFGDNETATTTPTNTNSNNGVQLGGYSTTTPATGNQGHTTTGTQSTPKTTAPRIGGTYYVPPPTYTGPGDLAISLIKVGRVLPNGVFEQTSSFAAGDRVSVQFQVSNVGQGRTGNWTLSARLPTQIGAQQNYTSITEPSIARGASYSMTLAFDSYDPNQNTIQIVLNAAEPNTANNTLTISVTGNGTSYNNGNNYNGQNGCYYQNGYYYCNNNYSYNYNYNNSNNCYYQGSQYICNNYNNGNNGCYYLNGAYVCGNNTNNNYPDLAVSIIATGVVNRSTGQFTSTNTITRNDRAAVQVEIRNIGNIGSSQWSLTGTLSNGGSNATYSSGTQNGIAAGSSQVLTVTFDNPTQGYQNVSLNALQLNSAYEANTGNNYASQTLYVAY